MIDSSVLVAAFCKEHPHFTASHAFLTRKRRAPLAASMHSVAETFASITRLPLVVRPSASMAAMYLDSLSAVIAWQSVLHAHYQAALERMEALQLGGGIVYDALILETALAHRQKQLITWNTRDFKRLVQAEKIEVLTPSEALA